MWLFVAFLAIPLIEIALFIQVGGLDRSLADSGDRGGHGCFGNMDDPRSGCIGNEPATFIAE